jgi:hypothetical protein
MSKQKKIYDFVSDLSVADYKTENKKELNKIVDDIFNQIELEAKLDYKDKEFQYYKRVLVLQNIIEDMANEMYMNKISFNNKIKMVNNVLNYK